MITHVNKPSIAELLQGMPARKQRSFFLGGKHPMHSKEEIVHNDMVKALVPTMREAANVRKFAHNRPQRAFGEIVRGFSLDAAVVYEVFNATAWPLVLA